MGISLWFREKILGHSKIMNEEVSVETHRKGCDKCGSRSPLTRCKGKYKFVCKKCNKVLRKKSLKGRK